MKRILSSYVDSNNIRVLMYEIDKNILLFVIAAIEHVIDGHLVNSVALFLVERS